MPAPIDRAAREREIAHAAIAVLASSGPGALTLRRLAQELGGSITLVTHVYPDRQALMEGLTKTLITTSREDLARFEAGLDDAQRLRGLLEWMLPLDGDTRSAEVGRVMLMAYRDTDLNVNIFYSAMDKEMRGHLRRHLRPFVGEDELEAAVEIWRVFANGVVLSVAERPEKWPRKRVLALLDSMMQRMGLSDAIPHSV